MDEITRYHWAFWFDHDGSDEARAGIDTLLEKIEEAIMETNQPQIKSIGFAFDLKEDITNEYN